MVEAKEDDIGRPRSDGAGRASARLAVHRWQHRGSQSACDVLSRVRCRSDSAKGRGGRHLPPDQVPASETTRPSARGLITQHWGLRNILLRCWIEVVRFSRVRQSAGRGTGSCPPKSEFQPAPCPGSEPLLFPDEMFTDLFPSPRGRPWVPVDVVATFAQQATGGEAPQRIFDAVRQLVAESGGCRQAPSRARLDCPRRRRRGQDAIMQLVAQIRRVRRLVPRAKALELSTMTLTTTKRSSSRCRCNPKNRTVWIHCAEDSATAPDGLAGK